MPGFSVGGTWPYMPYIKTIQTLLTVNRQIDQYERYEEVALNSEHNSAFCKAPFPTPRIIALTQPRLNIPAPKSANRRKRVRVILNNLD